jgi:hypothetical protein
MLTRQPLRLIGRASISQSLEGLLHLLPIYNCKSHLAIKMLIYIPPKPQPNGSVSNPSALLTHSLLHLPMHLKMPISTHPANSTVTLNSFTRPYKGHLVTVARAQRISPIMPSPSVSHVPSLCTCTSSLLSFNILLGILHNQNPASTGMKMPPENVHINPHLMNLKDRLVQDFHQAGWWVNNPVLASRCPKISPFSTQPISAESH